MVQQEKIISPLQLTEKKLESRLDRADIVFEKSDSYAFKCGLLVKHYLQTFSKVQIQSALEKNNRRLIGSNVAHRLEGLLEKTRFPVDKKSAVFIYPSSFHTLDVYVVENTPGVAKWVRDWEKHLPSKTAKQTDYNSVRPAFFVPDLAPCRPVRACVARRYPARRLEPAILVKIWDCFPASSSLFLHLKFSGNQFERYSYFTEVNVWGSYEKVVASEVVRKQTFSPNQLPGPEWVRHVWSDVFLGLANSPKKDFRSALPRVFGTAATIVCIHCADGKMLCRHLSTLTSTDKETAKKLTCFLDHANTQLAQLL